MSDQNNSKTLAQWKERAGELLKALTFEAARRRGLNLEALTTGRRDSAFGQKATLVLDPITLTVEDLYGGTFTCTYDISRTLSGLRKEFQQMEYSSDEIATFAKSQNISLDEATARMAFQYFEAELFSMLGAGRFLHDQLEAALKETLSELLDAAFLRATREYGCEIVDPSSTLEKHGRKHIKFTKQLTGIVPPQGRRPETGKAKKKRLQTERVTFVTGVRTAEQRWYGNGHRGKPSQTDLALLVYGIENKESAASMFSRKMRKHGLVLADILLGKKQA